jgi:hypothetical protein
MGQYPDPDPDLAHLKSRIRIQMKIVRICNTALKAHYHEKSDHATPKSGEVGNCSRNSSQFTALGEIFF